MAAYSESAVARVRVERLHVGAGRDNSVVNQRRARRHGQRKRRARRQADNRRAFRRYEREQWRRRYSDENGHGHGHGSSDDEEGGGGHASTEGVAVYPGAAPTHAAVFANRLLHLSQEDAALPHYGYEGSHAAQRRRQELARAKAATAAAQAIEVVHHPQQQAHHEQQQQQQQHLPQYNTASSRRRGQSYGRRWSGRCCAAVLLSVCLLQTVLVGLMMLQHTQGSGRSSTGSWHLPEATHVDSPTHAAIVASRSDLRSQIGPYLPCVESRRYSVFTAAQRRRGCPPGTDPLHCECLVNTTALVHSQLPPAATTKPGFVTYRASYGRLNNRLWGLLGGLAIARSFGRVLVVPDSVFSDLAEGPTDTATRLFGRTHELPWYIFVYIPATASSSGNSAGTPRRTDASVYQCASSHVFHPPILLSGVPYLTQQEFREHARAAKLTSAHAAVQREWVAPGRQMELRQQLHGLGVKPNTGPEGVQTAATVSWPALPAEWRKLAQRREQLLVLDELHHAGSLTSWLWPRAEGCPPQGCLASLLRYRAWVRVLGDAIVSSHLRGKPFIAVHVRHMSEEYCEDVTRIAGSAGNSSSSTETLSCCLPIPNRLVQRVASVLERHPDVSTVYMLHDGSEAARLVYSALQSTLGGAIGGVRIVGARATELPVPGALLELLAAYHGGPLWPPNSTQEGAAAGSGGLLSKFLNRGGWAAVPEQVRGLADVLVDMYVAEKAAEFIGLRYSSLSLTVSNRRAVNAEKEQQKGGGGGGGGGSGGGGGGGATVSYCDNRRIAWHDVWREAGEAPGVPNPYIVSGSVDRFAVPFPEAK